MTVEEKKAVRFRLLSDLYDRTDGSTQRSAMLADLGAPLGMDEKAAYEVASYLAREGLLQVATMHGHIQITHRGVKEIEEARSNPSRPTEHFPAINLIRIDKMVNSTIQQGSPGAYQAVQVTDPAHRDLADVLTEIRQSIDRLGLDAQQQVDLKGDIGTVEAQLQTSKPKKSVVSECLSTIRGLLDKAGGAVATGLAGKLVEHMTK
jgi:hypothetical protein